MLCIEDVLQLCCIAITFYCNYIAITLHGNRIEIMLHFNHKTNVITLTNYNRCRQSDEPIRTQRKYMSSAPKKRRKCMEASHGFGFNF